MADQEGHSDRNVGAVFPISDVKKLCSSLINFVCYQSDCQHGWTIVKAVFDKFHQYGTDGKWNIILI